MKVLIAIEDALMVPDIEHTLTSMPWKTGTKLKVMHAIEAAEAVAGWPSEQYRTEAVNLVSSVVARLRKALPQVEIEEVLVEAEPREAILEVAAKWPADLIVIGSHVRRGLERFVLGSVSQAITSHAPCPVLVIRQQARREAEPEQPVASMKNNGRAKNSTAVKEH